jgi:hypothetical protein
MSRPLARNSIPRAAALAGTCRLREGAGNAMIETRKVRLRAVFSASASLTDFRQKRRRMVCGLLQVYLRHGEIEKLHCRPARRPRRPPAHPIHHWRARTSYVSRRRERAPTGAAQRLAPKQFHTHMQKQQQHKGLLNSSTKAGNLRYKGRQSAGKVIWTCTRTKTRSHTRARTSDQLGWILLILTCDRPACGWY